MILERGGYSPLPIDPSQCATLPVERPVDLAIIDYNLGSFKAEDIAASLIERIAVPLIVLSDQQWLPATMEPFTTRFVRKGDPALLLSEIADALGTGR